MAKQNEPTPADPSIAYGVMAPRWALMNALLGGTETMRAAGEELMPKHQEESDPSWERRLSGATLLNLTELTLDMLAGKPFSDPARLDEDAPEQHVDWSDDVDLQGNNMDVFARRWFRDGMAKGLSHVLVEMPRKDPDEDRTVADDRADNIRPYLVHVPAESVLFMSGTIVAGREVLEHVRIYEGEVRREGWVEVMVKRVRVLEPGRVEIWELLNEGKRDEEWRKVDEWETDLDFIPLVTFYSQREGLGLAKPPLLDLAYLNVLHWQLEADLNNIIKVACFPMLAMSGVDTNETGGEGSIMTIGPNSILATRAPEGKFYYVEHTGAAIETGMKKLGSVEDQMSAYGAQFLRDKPGDLKATVRALDSAEALSQLQAITLAFKDSLETALGMMSLWADLDKSPTVEMSVDFGLNDPDETGWQAIDAARQRRDISRKALINELQRRGWISDEYDMDEDKEVIQEELDDIMDQMAKSNLDPLAPKPKEEDDDESDDT